VPIKSKVKISQNFVTFSEYMNFAKTHLENEELTGQKISDQNGLESFINFVK
jgi:hypothetical protein